jgi:hypothetical protein
MAKKKKLLPKDFEERLTKGDLEELKAVFSGCLLDARGGYCKQTALAFVDCPDDLARWLVGQGADIHAVDQYGNTPLHSRAGHALGRVDVLVELGANINNDSGSEGTPLHSAARVRNETAARTLVEHGAQVNSRNMDGLTTLELALKTCNNIDIERMVPLAEFLLSVGAERTDRMKEFVEKIGKNFEYYRDSFNKERVDAVGSALSQLYALFDVPPVPRRVMHDGNSPILVQSTTWQDQHAELWNLLVPGMGAAPTVQGEVVRIVGRIADELERNGGANWDADYKAMADAYVDILRQGVALSPSEIAEAAALSAEAKRKNCDVERTAKLAIRWVQLNPIPIPLEAPRYRR